LLAQRPRQRAFAVEQERYVSAAIGHKLQKKQEEVRC
jgi:hypothetical protein